MKKRDPRKIRCPKCKQRPIAYTEAVEDYCEWEADNNGFAIGKGDHSMMMIIPLRVEATCPNHHIWLLRGVGQITDLYPPTAEEGEKETDHE